MMMMIKLLLVVALLTAVASAHNFPQFGGVRKPTANQTFMRPWPPSFWAAFTVTKPEQGLWGVPGQVFFSGADGLQRTDYNVRCAFGGDPTQPCTIQMSTPENGIFLLTGLNRENCCLLFDGLGAPPPTWTSSNMFLNGTTYAFGQEVEIYTDGAPAPHVFFVVPGSQTPVLLQPENWLWQTTYVIQENSPGVMHRDLKPENFLFDTVEEDAKLKTTDFGLSVFYKPGETFCDVVGSPYYVAPEVLRKHYGPESDVWSAGVILYILLSGVPPFWAETEQGIFRQILLGRLDFQSEPWPSISDSAKDLIRKMLDRNPKTRLTAHKVLCHPWIIDDNLAPDKPLDSAVLSRLKQFSAMNKLKKMALRVIAERLSEEEIGGLKELFKMIDADNSGTITFDELKEGLKRVGSDLMESEIKDLMDAADIDNSGTLDYGEFIAATVHLNKLEREENLVSAFSYFDKDASGYITIDEIQQACKDFGLEDVHIDEIVKEIDQDNDGQIDYGEFAAMMRKGNGGIGRRTMRSTLNFRDALGIIGHGSD